MRRVASSQSEKAEIADKHAVTAEDAAEAAADARRRRPGLRQEEREEHDPEECGDGYRHEDRPPAEGGDQAAAGQRREGDQPRIAPGSGTLRRDLLG